MSRVGLKEVKDQNSPFLEDSVFTYDKIIEGKNRYAPFIVSPLVSASENKENASVQAQIQTSSAEVQTTVTVSLEAPAITEEDLTSESISVAFLRAQADKLDRKIEKELNDGIDLSIRLEESMTELREAESSLETLNEVVKEMLEEDAEEEDPKDTNV